MAKCKVDQSIVDRFYERVKKKGNPHGCWLWTGARRSKEGYGAIIHQGKRYGTHRFMLQFIKGKKIKLGKLVLHICEANYAPEDNTYKLCVRPSHLKIGTNGENIADAHRNGRYGRRSN